MDVSFEKKSVFFEDQAKWLSTWFKSVIRLATSLFIRLPNHSLREEHFVLVHISSCWKSLSKMTEGGISISKTMLEKMLMLYPLPSVLIEIRKPASLKKCKEISPNHFLINAFSCIYSFLFSLSGKIYKRKIQFLALQWCYRSVFYKLLIQMIHLLISSPTSDIP